MENKVYLIIFSEKSFKRDELKDFFNSKGGVIKHWFYNVNNSVFVNTTFQTPKELSMFIEERFGLFRHFIIQVTDSKYYGRLPTDHWDLMKKK